MKTSTNGSGAAFAHINARDFARVMPFRALGDVRYYLNGVRIEPQDEGAVIVATNGHMLAAAYSADTRVDEPVIVDVTQALATAVKRASKFEAVIRCATKTSRLEVLRGAGDESVLFVKPGAPFIEGKFPEWRKVLPAADKIGQGLPSSYNAEYLRQALAAVCDGPPARFLPTYVQFDHSNSAEPDSSSAILRAGPNFICLVMPARADRMAGMPSWAAAEASSAAVAA